MKIKKKTIIYILFGAIPALVLGIEFTGMFDHPNAKAASMLFPVFLFMTSIGLLAAAFDKPESFFTQKLLITLCLVFGLLYLLPFELMYIFAFIKSEYEWLKAQEVLDIIFVNGIYAISLHYIFTNIIRFFARKR